MRNYGYILVSKRPQWVGNYIYDEETAKRIAEQMNKDHKALGIKQKIEVKCLEWR